MASYVVSKKLKGEKHYPVVLMLEPLMRCNLACAGCGKIQYPGHVLKRDLTPAKGIAATIDDAVAHIAHAVKTAGIDHVGIGSDFDGISGPPKGLEDISKKAGVGPGTLYRHFPTREDLLVAVYRSEMEKLAAAGQTLADRMSPVEALRAWLLLLTPTPDVE